MTHDPLCPESFEDYCAVCELIAKVRKDESNHFILNMKNYWNAGYAFGLGDALIAVEAVDPPSESYDDWYPKGKRLALDALEALEALRMKEHDEAG